MIKFKDYKKSTKLTDMDRKNFVIHDNMETLQDLLENSNSEIAYTKELSNTFKKVNELIELELLNERVWEETTTKVIVLLKNNTIESENRLLEEIHELESLSDEALKTNVIMGYGKKVIDKLNRKIAIKLTIFLVLFLVSFSIEYSFLVEISTSFKPYLGSIIILGTFLIMAILLMVTLPTPYTSKYNEPNDFPFGAILIGFCVMGMGVLTLNPISFLIGYALKEKVKKLLRSTQINSNLKLCFIDTDYLSKLKDESDALYIGRNLVDEKYAKKLLEVIESISETDSPKAVKQLSDHLNKVVRSINIIAQ